MAKIVDVDFRHIADVDLKAAINEATGEVVRDVRAIVAAADTLFRVIDGLGTRQGDSADLQQARYRLDEAVMWATRHAMDDAKP